MKDIIWTAVTAVVLLFTVTMVRYELFVGNGDQHAASTLSQARAAGPVQPSEKTHDKNTSDKRAKSGNSAPQQVTVHSQAVGRKAEAVPVEPHENSRGTFLTQLTPEKLSQFQMSHGKKALPGPELNVNSPADVVENIDPAQLLQRLQGISEYQ